MKINFKSFGICLLISFIIIVGLSTNPANIAFAEELQYSLYYNGQALDEKGFYLKGTPYIPVTMIGEYAINPGIRIDTATSSLAIDLSKQTIILADDETTSFVKNNAGVVHIPLKTIDGVVCFPLNVCNQFFNLQYSIKESAIYLKKYTGMSKIAKVSQDEAQAIPSLAEAEPANLVLKKDDTVSVLGESDNYYKVELMDGKVVYILKTDIQVSEVDLSAVDFYAPRIRKFKQGTEKISLVWEYVDKITPLAPVKKTAGIDILSPTWFDLIVNGSGNVENNGDKGYSDLAHENGYKIWATVTNNMTTKGSTDYTSIVFNDQALLKRSVAQYLFYSCLYGVDGINIDYETVADSDADGLTAFTALLRQYTEKQGFVLSIDTVVPRPWTQEYDRDALAGNVDYIVVMTYDEHWGSSPVAGSVASLPWVEDAVITSLNEIPNEKLLLGIPFYMRAWHFDTSGNLVNTTSNSMGTIRTILAEKSLTPVWLDDEAQFYIAYSDAGLMKKIWIEDARSIAHKLDLVQKYNLAGTGSWRLGQEEPVIWSVFYNMLKKGSSVNEYNQGY